MRVQAVSWWRSLLGVLLLTVAPRIVFAQEGNSPEPVTTESESTDEAPEAEAPAETPEEPADPASADEPTEQPGEPGDEPATDEPATEEEPADGEPSDGPGETEPADEPSEEMTEEPGDEPAEAPGEDESEDPAEMSEETGDVEEDPADLPAPPVAPRGRKPGKIPATLPPVRPATEPPTAPPTKPVVPIDPVPLKKTAPVAPPVAPPVKPMPVKPMPAPQSPGRTIPTPAELRLVEGDLIAELAAAVRDEPGLHGAWVDVAQTDAGDYVLTAIVDEARSQAQSDRLQKIIRKYLAPHQFDFTYHRWPFGKVLAAVQAAVETTDGLDSCLVEDAFFTREETDLQLHLLGRVAADIQRVRVNEVSAEIVAKWAPANYNGTIQTDAAALVIVAPSPGVAGHFFDAGIARFTQRDYVAAEKAFQRSILEDPGTLEYHYWRIVAEIGAGQLDEAYTHVRPLTERRRAVFMSSEYVGVLYSLERVQGPLRGTLRNLEDRAFKEIPATP